MNGFFFRVRFMVLAGITAVAVMTLATCARDGGEVESTRVGASGGPKFTLPFDAYRLSSTDQARIGQAHTALMRQCVEASGFRWTMPEATGDFSFVFAGNALRYGLADVSIAQRYGYHVPDDSEATAAHEAWLEGLTSAELTALYGDDDDGGCAEQATARLRAGVSLEDMEWFTSLDFDSVDNSEKDAAVVAAFAAWSRCMAEQEFDYSNPLEAVEDPRWNLNSSHISSEEKSVATADVRCKESSDLISIRAGVETRMQNDLIAGYPDRFAELRISRDRYVRNADDVLSGS